LRKAGSVSSIDITDKKTGCPGIGYLAFSRYWYICKLYVALSTTKVFFKNRYKGNAGSLVDYNFYKYNFGRDSFL
jgi:hypothetical protein